jgi:hypothetical protein
VNVVSTNTEGRKNYRGKSVRSVFFSSLLAVQTNRFVFGRVPSDQDINGSLFPFCIPKSAETGADVDPICETGQYSDRFYRQALSFPQE